MADRLEAIARWVVGDAPPMAQLFLPSLEPPTLPGYCASEIGSSQGVLIPKVGIRRDVPLERSRAHIRGGGTAGSRNSEQRGRTWLRPIRYEVVGRVSHGTEQWQPSGQHGMRRKSAPGRTALTGRVGRTPSISTLCATCSGRWSNVAVCAEPSHDSRS